jgi:hypothetical protein
VTLPRFTSSVCSTPPSGLTPGELQSRRPLSPLPDNPHCAKVNSLCGQRSPEWRRHCPCGVRVQRPIFITPSSCPGQLWATTGLLSGMCPQGDPSSPPLSWSEQEPRGAGERGWGRAGPDVSEMNLETLCCLSLENET